MEEAASEKAKNRLQVAKKGCIGCGVAGAALFVLVAVIGYCADPEPSETTTAPQQRQEVHPEALRALAATRAARNAILRVDGADSDSVNLFSDEPVAAVAAIRELVDAARDERAFDLTDEEQHLAVAGCYSFISDVALRSDLSERREAALEDAGNMDLAEKERMGREEAFATRLYPAARAYCSVAGDTEVSPTDREWLALRFRAEIEAAHAGYYKAYFQSENATVKWVIQTDALSEFKENYREPASARRIYRTRDGSVIRDPRVRQHREMELNVARSHATQAADTAFAESRWFAETEEVDVHAALGALRQVRAEPLRGDDVRAMYAVNRDVLQGMLAGER